MFRSAMSRHAINFTVAVMFAATALLATPAFAQTTQQVPQRTLSLTGQAEVTSPPDIAVISAGVVSEAKSARDALTQNNKAMATVLQTIEAAGVAGKDIQTSSFFRPAEVRISTARQQWRSGPGPALSATPCRIQ